MMASALLATAVKALWSAVPNDRAAVDASVIWRANLGRGHSAVALAGHRLITMGSAEAVAGAAGVETLDVVWCLHANTGAVIWKYSYPCPEIYFAGPRATPVVDGERVFTVSWDGQVHCLDLNTGELLWRYDLVREEVGTPGHWGMAASPVVVGEVLVLSAGSRGAALSSADGRLVWQSDGGESSLASPVLLPGVPKRVLVPGLESLYAVEVRSGRELWSIPWDKDFYLSPVWMDDKLVVLKNRGAAIVAFKAGEPEIVREIEVRLSNFQSAAVVDAHLFALSGVHLVCVDLATGELCWREKVGQNGALSARDGLLFLLTGDGDLSVVEATPSAYRHVARWPVISTSGNAGVPPPDQHHCWTAPVVASGRVFLRSNHGQLVCLELDLDALAAAS